MARKAQPPKTDVFNGELARQTPIRGVRQSACPVWSHPYGCQLRFKCYLAVRVPDSPGSNHILMLAYVYSNRFLLRVAVCLVVQVVILIFAGKLCEHPQIVFRVTALILGSHLNTF